MMSFRGAKLSALTLPAGTVWLLTEIAEAKGKEALYTKQAPQVLTALRQMALIQSVESSNRIEGVAVAPDRLEPLVLGRARPKDRSEEEIQGYRRALALIHDDASKLEVEPDTMLRLHGLCQEGAGDAGKWKRVDNDIIELRPGQAPLVRFRAVKARETEAAIGELCLAYRHVVDQRLMHPLVATAALVLDFLCIHPFRDGNGRVSRLLTLLGLCRHGFGVGRFVSIERVVEESKDDYYAALYESSKGWHEDAHDILPWLNYFLGVLRRAYRELEQRDERAHEQRGAKTALVEAAVDQFPGDFTLRDLERACPGVGPDMVRRVLRHMKASGAVKSLGRGPGARWQRLRAR
ncbi:MAG: Fic family protein [Deltaproteobacteria bacterium]|nr:Fic family protein [Deltaproteobacteria bacterium]